MSLFRTGELDCVILTSHGPLILDLKAFSGAVRGSENGTWEVETKDGMHVLPNIFIQAKMHRQDFIDKMIPICRAHFPHIGENNLKKIGSWAYFCPREHVRRRTDRSPPGKMVPRGDCGITP